MAGLEELSLALRNTSQGKADLMGLDEDYARATKLRDTTLSKPDQYGQLSPLMAMADVLRQSKGRRDMRQLKPQRVNARNMIASGENAGTLYNARFAQDRATEADRQFGVTEENKVRAANSLARAKVAARKEKYGREDATGALVSKMSPDGAEHTVRYNKHTKKAYLDGEEITDFSKWTDPPTRTIEFPGGGYDDKGANKRAEEQIITLGNIDTAIGLTNQFSPETLERLNSVPERIKKGLIEGVLPSKAAEFVKDWREKDPAVKQYFTFLNSLSADQRHALFGAALTDVENRSANSFLAGVAMLPIDVQVQRLRDGITKGVDALGVMDSLHGAPDVYGQPQTKYMDAFNSRGYQHLGEPQAPQPAKRTYTDADFAKMTTAEIEALLEPPP